MSQALYRKWRPQQWAEVIGQDHVVQTLQNAIQNDHVGHAYLFSGPRGTGKTTTARLLAKAVNCLDTDQAKKPCDKCDFCTAVNEGRFLDLIEIDAASNTSVEDVRDLRDKINFSPSQGRYKVYIIDEVHMLSLAAFNALLKTLEEPPPHAIFILATTEAHKIPATVLSRCQRHEFRRIPMEQVIGHLKQVSEKENISIQPESLALISRQSGGCLRDAISLLDQLSSTGQKVTLTYAQQVLGTATNLAVINLVEALINGDNAGGLNNIHQALDSGTDPRQFARQIVEYLRSLLLINMNSMDELITGSDHLQEMHAQASKLARVRLLDMITLFNTTASESRSSWQPSLSLELAFAGAIAPGDDLKTSVVVPHTTVNPVPMAVPVLQSQTAAAQVQGISHPNTLKPTESPTRALPPTETGMPKTTPSLKSSPSQERVMHPTGGLTDQDFGRIKQNWSQIKAVIKKSSPHTEALLNSCRSVTTKSGNVVLGFISEHLRSMMSMEEHNQQTKQAIAQVTGLQVNILCMVSTAKGEIVNADLNLENEGMVNAALNMGGKIVNKK
jgi:DNA polymerase-3 subunit gamma/tau